MQTYAYGFPRLGRNREFKRTVEGFWNGKINEDQLTTNILAIDADRAQTYRRFVDRFAAGEMSLYDPMLDMAVMLGLYPEGRTPAGYFDLARGAGALEMVKWFNTNYHYLVPDVSPWESGETPPFVPTAVKPGAGVERFEGTLPSVIGPYTFLRLSQGYSPKSFGRMLRALVPVYQQLFLTFKAAGAGLVHVEEPAWATETPEDHIAAIREAYTTLGEAADLLVMTYYDGVDFLDRLLDLPIRGLGLDLVHGPDNLAALRRHGFPGDKVLVAGIVDGINVWKTDLPRAAGLVRDLQAATSAEVWLSNAGPLYHLPISAAAETDMDPALRERLAFADERLAELRLLKMLLTEGATAETQAWNGYQHPTDHWYDTGVRRRVDSLSAGDFTRALPYEQRDPIQRKRLRQNLFPTTTIGSFPQTEDVRRTRLAYRSGKITDEDYWRFIQGKIEDVIELQQGIGLDVLVHGEFERTDMVEYFAEKLRGIATVRNGWVLSYGSRIYRRPIIYGDIVRSESMTVREIAYAQSLTRLPVKGMLTGPVTILAWTYARQDIPAYEVAYQLALALQDEVADLDTAGIGIIQIDEPAFRELAPLKRRGWADYFEWAVKAYRLASRARPEIQIHTHMCYSEFNEIIEAIAALDADVTTIAATRSRGDVIEAFERFRYPLQIGPGVYDVHSPSIPTVESMVAVIERVIRLLPKELIWVNPDCGLKTRRWEEVIPSLRNMVEAARRLRDQQ